MRDLEITARIEENVYRQDSKNNCKDCENTHHNKYTTSSARNVIKIIIRFQTLLSKSDQNSIYLVLTSDVETDGR